MKKLLVLIIVAVAVVFGIKLYAENEYRKELDKGVRLASSFVDVRYDDVSFGFDGSVTLTGLSVQPFEASGAISVKTIRLDTYDPLLLVMGQRRFKKGEYPKRLKFAFNGLSVPADLYEEAFVAEECRSMGGFLQYSKAGYDTINADFVADLDLADPSNGRIDMRGSDQMMTYGFGMNLNVELLGPAALISGTMPIDDIRYDFFLDEVVAESLVKHCAELFKVSPEAYKTKVMASKKFFVNSVDIDLGEKAHLALADFLSGGKEFVFRMEPSDRILKTTSPDQLSTAQKIRLLNVSAFLDGSSVPIQTFASSRASDDGLDEDSVANSDGFKRRGLDELLNGPDTTLQRAPVKSSRKKRPTYSAASLNNASQYVDQDVRVKRTAERSDIKGRLLGVENSTLAVEMYRYGGVMTYKVPFKDVAKFETRD